MAAQNGELISSGSDAFYFTGEADSANEYFMSGSFYGNVEGQFRIIIVQTVDE